MSIVKLLKSGAIVLSDSYVNPREYQRPGNDGFIRDRLTLLNDVRTVGRDMGKAIERNGKSADQRNSKK